MRIAKSTMRILAWILVAALLTGCGSFSKPEPEAPLPSDYKGLMSYFKDRGQGDEVVCWYTSDEDRTWLENVAKDFEKEYSVSVTLVYYDGASFFEDMNQANQTGAGPDVYIAGNDQIELAVLGGMVQENTWLTDSFLQDMYPETAVRAITYKEKRYGYPVYFDTYCLIYDANLLENAPASIEDILAFADEYEDTGSTKAIFRWDVADPYINTMFLNAYADLFGDNGDESSKFMVNSGECIAAMEYFQSLSAYFWMNKNNISHDTIVKRIREGTLVLGLCKTDILPTLYELHAGGEQVAAQDGAADEDKETGDEAGAAGEKNGTEDKVAADETDYQVSYVPSLTSELSSQTLSTTYGAFVNPYGQDAGLANLFALYLSCGQTEKQYAGNGKLPVVNQKDGLDSLQSVIYAQYLNSKPVPKVMVLGDYLSESAIAFDRIWGGEDVTEQLNQLQNKMQEKIE